MQISKISIRNILGIDQLELTPKGFTQISGKNGTGKTSVLEAIKAVVATGHDATLLRDGADKGEVVFVLDDGMEISKTVTASGSTTAVRRDGKKLARPAETIKALTDALSVNPIEFLLAKPKERARVLLDAMPLEADAKHLSDITGFDVPEQPGVHALHVIEQVRKAVYDDRTGLNRAISEKKATISQLEAAVPPAPAGAEGGEDELVAKLAEVDAKRDTSFASIDRKLTSLRADRDTNVQALREKLQADIDALKTAAQEEVQRIDAEQQEQEQKAAAAREKVINTHAAATQPLNTQLQVIRNDREAAGRRKQTLETIGNLSTELQTLEADSLKRTQGLDAIELYKNELLKGLPIPGLEIRDGEIYRGNVVFDRLNTAQQVEIAVEVAKLRAADLGVICVDKIEALDAETLKAFRERSLESGLQLFVTRVDDSPFNVETTDE